MGHSYTPGLTVTERTIIRKRRLLPIPGTILVQDGDRIGSETVVARTELPGKVHPLNVANLLGAAPDEINEYLIKKAGEKVQRDEVVAENKPLIKWFKTEVRSPIDGTLESASTLAKASRSKPPAR
jgi:hypothetical protein